jgi:hypothetical protein
LHFIGKRILKEKGKRNTSKKLHLKEKEAILLFLVRTFDVNFAAMAVTTSPSLYRLNEINVSSLLCLMSAWFLCSNVGIRLCVVAIQKREKINFSWNIRLS